VLRRQRVDARLGILKVCVTLEPGSRPMLPYGRAGGQVPVQRRSPSACQQEQYTADPVQQSEGIANGGGRHDGTFETRPSDAQGAAAKENGEHHTKAVSGS
jgi:hypothetical protein